MAGRQAAVYREACERERERIHRQGQGDFMGLEVQGKPG